MNRNVYWAVPIILFAILGVVFMLKQTGHAKPEPAGPTKAEPEAKPTVLWTASDKTDAKRSKGVMPVAAPLKTAFITLATSRAAASVRGTLAIRYFQALDNGKAIVLPVFRLAFASIEASPKAAILRVELTDIAQDPHLRSELKVALDGHFSGGWQFANLAPGTSVDLGLGLTSGKGDNSVQPVGNSKKITLAIDRSRHPVEFDLPVELGLRKLDEFTLSIKASLEVD
jgi:hypothetical protein